MDITEFVSRTKNNRMIRIAKRHPCRPQKERNLKQKQSALKTLAENLYPLKKKKKH